MSSPVDPVSWYIEQGETAGREENAAERTARVLSHARLVALLIAIVAAVLAEVRNDATSGRWWLVAIAAGLGFIALVAYHRAVRTRLEYASTRRVACQLGIARVRRAWGELSEPYTPGLSREQTILAGDLGVTGHISLATLCNVVTPALGGARLLQWLLADPPSVEAIAERSASVAALRIQPETLLGFIATPAIRGPRLVSGTTAFQRWASAIPASGVLMRARLFALVSVALVATVIALIAMKEPEWALLTVVAQLALTGVARTRIERDLKGLDDAFTQSAAILRSLDAARTLRDVPGTVGALSRQLLDDRAREAMRSLRTLLDWNNVRYSPLGLWMMNALGGMDAHLWHGINRWRARHGSRVAGWIASAAEIEAHVAMATLGFDNPDWVSPTVTDAPDAPALGVVQLGHPLIATDAAVRNDLSLDANGAILIVSGSNMSGKTTYLRAAGLCALLAQAGGPVCAAAVTMRRCRVRTSVRIQDDLASGISLFLAEATRLRDIVVDARHAGQPPVLFLLDEILHGTNAADRRTATQLVLGHLAQAGAFGLVTTHDPTIAPAGGRAHQVHFGEGLGGDHERLGLTFDYRVRPGPATAANAMAILRALGL